MADQSSGGVELTHMGVIRAQGTDAVSFLQGQLTQDVALLGTDRAPLAAYCNAKGRMQASFIVIKRSPEEALLICGKDSLAPMIKRLSMFVLRAKVKLSDATSDFRMVGLTGGAAQAVHDAAAPWTRRDIGAAMVVSLYPGDGIARACWLAPAETQPPQTAPISLALWHWLSVRSGIAMVGQACFEAFVPQMLNYESVGGVSFKKGCYPGQEVVARSQFRGTIKRRAYLVHADVPVAVGQEVFHSSEPEQACGLVAAAAPRPNGQGFDAIVSMQTSVADAAQADPSASLRAAGPHGPALSLLPLPYPLLADL